MYNVLVYMKVQVNIHVKLWAALEKADKNVEN